MSQAMFFWVIVFFLLTNLGCGVAGFKVVEGEDENLNRRVEGDGAQLPIDSSDGDAIGDGGTPIDDQPADGSVSDPDGNQPIPLPPAPNACEAYLDLSCQRPHESKVILGPQEFYQDLDLNAADLTGEALYQSFWQRVELVRSCAAEVNLTQAVWSQVNASHSNLQLAVFFGSELSRSQFGFAHLRQSSFNRSRLADLSFGEACLKDAIFRETEFRGSTDFTNAIAPGADFFRSFFSGTASFQEADLRDANFEQAIFDRPISFRGADLRGVNFFKVEIASYIDFSDADLSGAVWSDGRICALGSIGRCL